MKNQRIGLFCGLFCAVAAWAGQPVDYEVDGQVFEGYVETQAPGTPMVLLLHDWDGLTEYEMKRAQMLAAQGYAVFCADLFGKGVRPTEMADRRRCTGELDADRPRMRRLMQGALAAAKAQGLDVSRCVAMGYCFGGTAVLELARSGAELKGFASFHGGLTLPSGQDYSQAKGPLLVLHGTADSHVTMDHFAQLAQDMETAGTAHEMVSYGGAPHGWTVFGSPAYREGADQKSWAQFGRFLAEVLKNEGIQ